MPALNPKSQLASVFEPSVTTAIFNEMLKEHGITVVTARLDLKNGVAMDGKRIQKIRTEDGREFAGKMFSDATYEGDLLPGAGVSFTVRREANTTYNETINGIQAKRALKNQVPDGIDPYISRGNPSSGISNNFIGANYGKDWNWATLNHDERLALAKKHEHWQRGLVWTLQNHPRVPENIRKQYSKWGLPKDEFTDNKHWPHQIYVHEARRMISDFVMAEHHCTRKQAVPESIGLAAYTMDSHAVQRCVKNGMVKNEGDVQVSIPGPYPVSYRAIVPKKGECENLLVTWSLSASHMAFGSIRMEPVFMILSQSAATAADIAMDHGVSVQDVPYEILKKRLLEDDQRLQP